MSNSIRIIVIIIVVHSDNQLLSFITIILPNLVVITIIMLLVNLSISEYRYSIFDIVFCCYSQQLFVILVSFLLNDGHKSMVINSNNVTVIYILRSKYLPSFQSKKSLLLSTTPFNSSFYFQSLVKGVF